MNCRHRGDATEDRADWRSLGDATDTRYGDGGDDDGDDDEDDGRE